MPEINGKQVIFREKLEAATWWPLFPKLTAALRALGNAADDEARGMAIFEHVEWSFVCAVISGMVESWEFEGSPKDEDSIGSLDLFSQALPIFTAAVKIITERFSVLGEAARRSSLASSEDSPSDGTTGASG